MKLPENGSDVVMHLSTGDQLCGDILCKCYSR